MIRLYTIDDEEQIRSIFFDNSVVRNFSSSQKKEAFFQNWCGQYLKLFASWCWVASDGKEILGYLISCPDMDLFQSQCQLNPGQQYFSHLWQKFPAHFHINCSLNSQGRGIGSQLIKQIETRLKSEKIPGVHLITDPANRNINFYGKNDFDFREVKLTESGDQIMFMGKEVKFS